MEKGYGLTMRGIIKNENGEILLLKRCPNCHYGSEMWELPGGKVDKGEFFDEALIREIKEETGLNSKLGDFCEGISEKYPHKRTVQIIMYLKDVEGDVKISDEHIDYMWADIEKMKKLEITPALKKLLEKKEFKI
ncbi:MAG: NUDIX domain-containing protein [Methanobrevibacter sp.]|uniref:NUDIX domain-containing protein n=1 Tax=Methanobrevibacter sp. TaxID=66852 RepID=UPI0026E08CA8|nr:NUDIX domain-containing protein [Methanobrevibacter sp.]MDO5848605.1 NUDIX domain-containing protein [Methanobrevibacter sp.]